MKKEDLKPLEFCAHTIAFKHFIETQWIEFAGQLKKIRDEALYKGRWDSFEDFLQDPSMGIDRASGQKMIAIFEKFVLEYKIDYQKIAAVGGWSKVAEILPIVKDKKEAVKWLNDASLLSKADLRKEIQEHKTGIEMAKCKHEDYYIIKICRKCKDKIFDGSHPTAE